MGWRRENWGGHPFEENSDSSVQDKLRRKSEMMGGQLSSRFQEIGLAWKDRFRSCYHLDGNCNLTGNFLLLDKVFLQRSLVGCCLWSHTESDPTEAT